MIGKPWKRLNDAQKGLNIALHSEGVSTRLITGKLNAAHLGDKKYFNQSSVVRFLEKYKLNGIWEQKKGTDRPRL